MKTPELEVINVPSRPSPWKVEVPASLASNGTRQRRFFKTRIEADGFIATLRTHRRNYGTSASILPPSQSEDAATALKLLADEGLDAVTLQATVRAFIAAHREVTASKTVRDAFIAFMAAKKRSTIYATEFGKLAAAIGVNPRQVGVRDRAQ